MYIKLGKLFPTSESFKEKQAKITSVLMAAKC